MNILTTYISRVIFIAIIVGWFVLFFFSSPEALIEYTGVENGYLLILILSFISGLSIFGVAPYHLVLIALAAGGLDPWLLAISAALGLAIGDSTSYFLGYQGRAIIPRGMEKVVRGISNFLEKYKKFLPVYIFLYGALVPFSNDFVGVTMGLARHPYWRVMIPLTLGTFVFNSVLALSAPYAYDLLQALFS